MGIRDVIIYGKAVTAGTVLSVLVNLGLYRFMGFSRTVFVIYWIILLALVTASRFSYRLIGEATPKNPMKCAKKALIYGAGAAGQLAMQEIEGNRNLDLTVVGFIDDDIGKQNRRFMGYPVFGGRDSLKEVVDRHGISEVVISFRDMDKAALSTLKRECSALGVNLSRLRVLVE